MRSPRAVTPLLAALLIAAAAGAARAEWRQAETEHFLIVFERQDQASADELASICEDVYAKVTGFFRSYPRKVPVVVRGRLDYANGLTAPFPERLELIVTAPSWPWMGSTSESWLRVLLTHELTHYVHLGMERGFFHGLSRVFGADVSLATAAFLPGWMLEGPTTNLETIFTSGGRGRNPFFEAQYKAPAMEGELFSLAQASYASAYPPSGRIYVAGWVLVDHLLDEYGMDVVTRIMDEYLPFPFLGPWKAIERVTGKTARDIHADMKADLEDRYRADAAVVGGRLVSPDRIGDWRHPVPTPRGLYASRSDLESYPSIVRLSPDGSEQTIATLRLTDPWSFAATADGRTVYAASFFADWRPTDGEVVVSDLSVIDAETGSTRRITTAAHLWHPAVSADGQRLVAVQACGPYTRLVEVDPRSGGTRILFSIAGANVFNPAFSPDGTRIALVLNRRGVQDVVVIDYAAAAAGPRVQADPQGAVDDVNAGLAVFVLGPDTFGEYFPSWDGNDRVLFSTDRSGSLAMCESDLATGVVTLVQRDPVAVYEGIVEGDSLIYASYSSKGWCLKENVFRPDTIGTVAVDPSTALPLPAGAATAPVATASIPSAPYRDAAWPYLWYPLVTLGSGDPSGWDVGVGVEVLAGSLVGTSAWSIGAAWHPLTSQPEISFAASHGFGNATVEVLAGTAYHAAAGSYTLESDGRLGVSVPLVWDSAYDRGTSLSVGAGATFVSQVGSASPFTLADAFTDPALAWAHGLLLDADIGFGWAGAGGAIDLVTPRLARVSVGSKVMLPVFDGSTGARFTLFAQAGMPVFWQHLVARAGLRAAYGMASLDSSREGFAVPRGIFDPEARPLSGRLLASLDLLVPIGLFDQPLLLGFALLGMSAGIHVEAAADWDFDPAAFQVPWICAGAEVTFQIGASNQNLPIGVGLAARFDPTGVRTFDVASDLRPYFFLSFDSFRDAWASGGAGAGVRLERR